MELMEGDWLHSRGTGAPAVRRLQPPRRTAHAFMGLVDFKAQHYADAEEHFKSAGANPIGELTQHAGAGVAVPGAGQDAGGAGAAGCAEAAGLGAILSALSSSALLADQAGSPRRGARGLRAHAQERPAHPPRHAGLRPARGQRRRHQAGAERAQGARRAHEDRGASDRTGAAGADRSRRAPGAADRDADRGAGGGVLRPGRGAASEGGIGVGAVYLQMALYLEPNAPFALAALANVYETTKNYRKPSTPMIASPEGTPRRRIDIRKALNLNSLDRVDEAKACSTRWAPRTQRKFTPWTRSAT